MRRAAWYVLTYVGALLVGSTAVRILQAGVDRAFGVLTGPLALVYVLTSIAVFVVVTAWAFSVFAVPATRRASSTAAK